MSHNPPYPADYSRVTTVLNEWGEGQEPLMNWAARTGFSWQAVRGMAAKIGTLTHNIIEAALRGEPVDTSLVPPAYREKVLNACNAWMDWRKDKHIEMIINPDTGDPLIEASMVSHELKLGGTVDLIARINGHICMVDWKTSSKLGPKYKLQLAAYGILAEETLPWLGEIEYFIPVRLDKNMGYFEDIGYSDMTVAREMFMHLHAIHQLRKDLAA